MQILTHMWSVLLVTVQSLEEGLTRAGKPFSIRAELDTGDSLGVSGQRKLHSIVWFGWVGLKIQRNPHMSIHMEPY